MRSTIANFNSQPREGGWRALFDVFNERYQFHLTAARRRLAKIALKIDALRAISTHSRAKAAGGAWPLWRG